MSNRVNSKWMLMLLFAPLLMGNQGCSQSFEPVEGTQSTRNTATGPNGGETPLGGSNPGTGGGSTTPDTGGGGSGTTPPSSSPTITPELKAAFRSLHQYSVRVATPPAPGTFDYGAVNLVGFKSQYDPNESIAGCATGALANTSCAFPWTGSGTVGLSFTEALINYNVPSAFRFFVTSGSTDVRMTGYSAQRTAIVFAVRMGRAPTRTAAVTAAEYSSIQANEKIDTSFARLSNGEEILVAHDGGGTVRFLSGRTNTSGGWIFIRQLPIASVPTGYTVAPTLYDIQLAVVADKSAFINHYRSLTFDSSGDPQ